MILTLDLDTTNTETDTGQTQPVAVHASVFIGTIATQMYQGAVPSGSLHSSKTFIDEFVVSFDEPEFEVLRPFKISVEQIDGDGQSFVASFASANVSASGESVNDAVVHLKDMIAGTFNHLDLTPVANLGKEPLRQLTILRSFIRRKPK
jgi:hypothetical protein